MEAYRKVVKGLLGVMILPAMLLAVAVSPSSAAPQAQASKHVSYNGISFTYDTSLASGVVASTVPELKGDANTACWTTHPDEIVFDFKDFGYSSGKVMPATLYLFPVNSNYRCLNPFETIDFWGREYVALRNLLAQRPKLTEPAGAQGPGGTPRAFLPPINAGGFLVGKQGYLNFRNGSGVRYLVHFAQYVSAPNHEDTIYTYQGLTADGKYYVAAQFPAFLATPPNLSIPQTGRQQDLDNYYMQLRRIVDRTGSAGFLPNLDSLDRIVASLTVNSSAVRLPSSPASPGMPGTGAPANQELPLTASLAVLALVMTLAGLAMRVGRRARR